MSTLGILGVVWMVSAVILLIAGRCDSTSDPNED